MAKLSHQGDGRCVLDIFLKENAVSDSATGNDILNAARTLINQCVKHIPRSTGGYVSNVGKKALLSTIFGIRHRNVYESPI